MPENADNPLSFWQELKRRKVIRVITVYAAAAFVILELVDILSPSLGLPTWTLNFILVLLCVGFVLVVILSWIYDITPEGIEKTKPVEEVKEKVPEKPSGVNAWKIATIISVVVIIVMVIFNVVRNTERSNDIQKLEKTIAVLPFANWSSDEENAHMGDAIANEIITQLSKIKAFHVFSFTSSSHYKGSDKPSTPQIGKELGANFIIEGSVERQDEDVSIHVQVIQAENDYHIWAHEFKDRWENIFTIRAQIAVRIAEELKTVLSPEEIKQIEKNPTHSNEAYKLYLKARFFQNKRTEEGLEKAIDYYQEAIHLDPNYALAYSGLAISYTAQYGYGFLPKDELLQKIKEATAKSLELDNQLGEAHFALGLFRDFDLDLVGAEEEYLLAIKLNPNLAEAHQRYGYILSALGRSNEAIKEAKTALELEPVNPIMMRTLGFVYYVAREYDLAIKECNKCLEIDPNQYFTYMILWLIYNQKGMYDDATTALENYLIALKKSDIAALIRRTFEESGYNRAIRQLLDVLLEQSIGFLSNPTYKSIFFTVIGDKDKAIEWLEKAYDQPEAALNYLQVGPMYDSLRSDPRFQDLLDRMNFPDN